MMYLLFFPVVAVLITAALVLARARKFWKKHQWACSLIYGFVTALAGASVAIFLSNIAEEESRKRDRLIVLDRAIKDVEGRLVKAHLFEKILQKYGPEYDKLYQFKRKGACLGIKKNHQLIERVDDLFPSSANYLIISNPDAKFYLIEYFDELRSTFIDMARPFDEKYRHICKVENQSSTLFYIFLLDKALILLKNQRKLVAGRFLEKSDLDLKKRAKYQIQLARCRMILANVRDIASQRIRTRLKSAAEQCQDFMSKEQDK